MIKLIIFDKKEVLKLKIEFDFRNYNNINFNKK